MAFLKFEFFPPHLAECIPGFFPSISTSRPESSAKHIKLVFFEKYFDFINEFSSKVLPFSIGLLSLKSNVEYVLILFGSKSLISFNFPLLLVPIIIFFIFFF